MHMSFPIRRKCELSMANIAASIARSRAVRGFIANLETKLPVLREWHRFEYQIHFSRTTGKARMFSGVYDTLEAAKAAIPKNTPVGYEHLDAADRHVSEIGHVWPSDYPVLFWLRSLLPEIREVFDLGGAVGRLFYAFRKYVSCSGPILWTVCEVPAVASRGREVAKIRNAEGLSFTTSFDDANDAGVLLASGSLQFIEDPLSALLGKLTLKPRHVLVNRSPFCDSSSFLTLHNLGPVICAYRIQNRAEFLAAMEAIGYSLIDAWKTPEFSCYIPFHPERAISSFEGMYFRRDRESV